MNTFVAANVVMGVAMFEFLPVGALFTRYVSEFVYIKYCCLHNRIDPEWKPIGWIVIPVSLSILGPNPFREYSS